MLSQRKVALLFTVSLIAVFAAAACGTDDGGSAESASNGAGSAGNTQLPLIEDMSASGDGAVSNDEPGTPSGGLDPACVDLVLGRTVTGFGDITEAERTRVFEECSQGAPGLRDGGARFAGGFDPICVEAALGVEAADLGLTELTAEQRQTVFDQCGGEERIGRPGGDGQRPAGGFGDFAGNECIQNALGRTVTDFTQLSQQEIQQLFTQCADELGLPAGGFGGGFGGQQGGGPGGFGGFGGGQGGRPN